MCVCMWGGGMYVSMCVNRCMRVCLCVCYVCMCVCNMCVVFMWGVMWGGIEYMCGTCDVCVV